MAWIRLDDGFVDHPKVEAAGEDAAWMHICALSYCSRQLSDGFVPTSVALRLTNRRGKRALIRALVQAGLWHEEEGGYRIHDYLKYQSARADVEADRARARERARAKSARRSAEVPPKFAETSRATSHHLPTQDTLSSSSDSRPAEPPVDDDDEMTSPQPGDELAETGVSVGVWQPITGPPNLVPDGDPLTDLVAADPLDARVNAAVKALAYADLLARQRADAPVIGDVRSWLATAEERRATADGPALDALARAHPGTTGGALAAAYLAGHSGDTSGTGSAASDVRDGQQAAAMQRAHEGTAQMRELSRELADPNRVDRIRAMRESLGHPPPDDKTGDEVQ